ncbi:uncharacterized protein ACRADG_001543 [Cochliomyia hominivorax]
MGFSNFAFGFLIFFVILEIIHTKSIPNENISFVEKINFEYKNAKWICGDIKCPEDTFGCKIRVRSDKSDKKVVYQSFSCIDKDRNGLLGAGDIINLNKERSIDIQLESYDKAISVYSTSYGLGGHEFADGVVAAEDLNNLKKDFKNNKKVIEESNA